MGHLVDHLRRKSVHIVITNVCNLSCGGCTQHCGLFSKEKLFFITKEQFLINVKVASKMNKFIHLFGGEACLHPDIEDFLSVSCEYPDHTFFLWTNGRYKNHTDEVVQTRNIGISYRHTTHKNVVIQVDHPKDGRRFIPTLVAPQDVSPLPEKEQYFTQYAYNNCPQWKFCQILFYDHYAYACECAGSFDKIADFNNGWEIKDNFLDELTDEDVIKQLTNFCYRCALCLPKDIQDNFVQKTEDPPLYSLTNLELLPKHKIVGNPQGVTKFL